MEDISIWSKSKVIDSDSRFCVRIVTIDCIYFLQVNIFRFVSNRIEFFRFFKVNSIHLRDQWFYSIQWRVRFTNLSSSRRFSFLEKQIEIRTNSSLSSSTRNSFERNDGKIIDQNDIFEVFFQLECVEYDRFCDDNTD